MKNPQDFAVDSTIQSKGNKKRKGVVLNNALKGQDYLIAVEWDDGTLAKVHVDDVEPSDSMEEEFKALQAQVNEKIDQAVSLIREANKLAKAQGYDLRSYDNRGYDYFFNQHELEYAMDEAGWNTSSWHC